MRMTPNRFEYLFTLIWHRIEKRTTRIWKPISAPQRLALTLRYVAIRESQQSLSLSYRIAKSTVCQIVSKTVLAIYNSLKDPYLKAPSSKEEWFNMSAGFEDTWNFCHCISAIDGKHIRIEYPKMAGTYYYNYKGVYSFARPVICDSNYCFTLFDIGHYGSNNDSGVLAKSKIGEMIEAR